MRGSRDGSLHHQQAADLPTQRRGQDGRRSTSDKAVPRAATQSESTARARFEGSHGRAKLSKPQRTRTDRRPDTATVRVQQAPLGLWATKAVPANEVASNDAALATSIALDAALVARARRPPISQADADEQFYIRALRNDETLRRQEEWEDHRIRRERKLLVIDLARLGIRLLGIASGLAMYLIGIIVLVRAIPGISARQAATIVGSAFALASGGLAVTHLAGRRRPTARPPDLP
jgi:hypothetical protein